jgi:hypothetical protein
LKPAPDHVATPFFQNCTRDSFNVRQLPTGIVDKLKVKKTGKLKAAAINEDG